MRKTVGVSTLVVAILSATAVAVIGQRPDVATYTAKVGFPPPYWAYPANPPDYQAPVDDGVPRQVPDSNVRLTLTQIRDLFTPPDWHPEDHPPMLGVVGKGRQPRVWACGYCHMPSGFGKAENANVTNLPEAYFKQQVADFKNGARRSSRPDILPQAGMVAAILPTTDAEIDEAYRYFSKNTLTKPRIRIVETNTVQKTSVQGSWVLAPIEGAGTEPIGQRIIESPEHPDRTTLRDERALFVAYVPAGSIKKGERLVTTGGNGKTVQCTMCHGADLRGLGPIPAIAGRSAIYTFRQLYDFKSGARHGAWSAMMTPAVEKLTLDDMIAIAAYSSSRMP